MYTCASWAERSRPSIICLHLNLNVPLPMQPSEKWKRYQQMINKILTKKKCQETHHFMFCRRSWCLFVLCTYFQKFCGSGDNTWSMKHFCVVISFFYLCRHTSAISTAKRNVKTKTRQKYVFYPKIWTCSNSNVSSFETWLGFRINSKN